MQLLVYNFLKLNTKYKEILHIVKNYVRRELQGLLWERKNCNK